jgi:nitrogen fixation NifU-like protein
MDLYQDLILQHNKKPFHFAKAEEADYVIEAYNPLCGDRFKLYLNVGKGAIQEVHFHGYGCAISKASTSVLAKNLSHLPFDEALKMCEHFLEIINSEDEIEVDNPEFKAFEAAKNYPGRDQCATLSWE